MSIVPILKSAELIRLLIRAGFRVVRQSGSHIRLQHITDSTRQTTVPIHSVDLPRWLLSNILRQAKISITDLVKLIGRR